MTWFRNYYIHDDCEVQPGIEWHDQWSAMCNDECPACGAEIEPTCSATLEQNDE